MTMDTTAAVADADFIDSRKARTGGGRNAEGKKAKGKKGEQRQS